MSDSPSKPVRGWCISPLVAELLRQKKIQCSDAILLSIIDSFKDTEKGCFASNEWLASSTGLHPKSVSRAIHNLSKLGILCISGKEKFSRTLSLKIEDVEDPVFLGNKMLPPTVANCYHPGNKMLPYSSDSITSKSIDLSLGATESADEDTHMLEPSSFVLEEAGQAQTGKVSTIDQNSARTLLDALKRVGRLTKDYSISSWSKQMYMLRKYVRDDTRLNRVLSWYCNHIGEQYVPVAFSAKSFREKFPAIEQAMNRTMSNSPSPVELSEESKRIITSLSCLIWPKDSAKQLPQSVQVSVDNYSKFKSLHYKVYSQSKKTLLSFSSQKTSEFRRYWTIVHFSDVLFAQLLQPIEFVEQWFTKIWKRVHRWEEWSGNLLSLAFKFEHKDFQKLCNSLANQWGEVTAWDTLCEELRRI